MVKKSQTICLSMIVKNEARVITRCLESVKQFVDAWGIVDTGSTDDTKGLVVDALSGITGDLATHPAPQRRWYQRAKPFDFAYHRNLALDLARRQGCDYILLIDADEQIVPDKGFDGSIPHLDQDRYVANFRMVEVGRIWHRSILIKSATPWVYKWPIHEILHCEHETTASVLGGLEIHSYSDGARNNDRRGKYLRDAAACLAAAKAEPKEPRHWFYYAQSLAGAGEYRAAIAAYERRIEMGGGWDEELWFSLHQLAPLKQLLGYHWRDVLAEHLRAFNARPWRAEPLAMAGVLCRDNGEAALGEVYLRAACGIPYPQRDSFLINEAIYAWSSADELAGCLAILGRRDECLTVLRRLMDCEHVPPADKERISNNIEIALKQAA